MPILEPPSRRRQKILLDVLAYAPADGGFSTSVEAMLEAAQSLNDFDFGVVYHRSNADLVPKGRFIRHAVSFPQQLKFLAPLWITPRIAARYQYSGVHADISVVSASSRVATSMRVHDLHFLMYPESGRQDIMHRTIDAVYRRTFRRSVASATVVSAISECTRRDIRRLMGRNDEIPLLPHAVNPRKYFYSERKWPGKGEPIRLLFVGSIVPRKNLGTLMKALRLISRPWTLDLVGNIWWGAKELTGYSNDTRIHLHGFVPELKLREFYSRAHVVLVPSLYEGFGLPALEAIASGCLALTSSGSAFDEYIPSRCLFSPLGHSELASLVNKLDDEQYSALMKQSRMALEKYSPVAQVAAYRDVFLRLVDAKHKT